MTKRQIQDELTRRHIAFAEYVLALDKADYLHSYDRRWTAGQQLSHITKSVSWVLTALKFPLPVVKMIFGTPAYPSRTYQQLVLDYKLVLRNGGKAGKLYLPGDVTLADAGPLKKQLLLAISRINLKTETFSEQTLDAYCLPHPLLGKITIREMLYFTMYHVEHHMEKTQENLRYIGSLS